MGKKDIEANETTSLLESNIPSPPPYTLEAEPSAPVASSSTSASAARSPSPAAVASAPLYPALPPSTSTRHPTGPSPLLSLPPPVLLRRPSHRAADRRARCRFLGALFWGFLVWLLIVNLLKNPDLEGVRREVRRDARAVWRWIKGEWREGERWGREHHVGEKLGRIINPGQGRLNEGDQIMTIQAVAPTPSASSQLAQLD